MTIYKEDNLGYQNDGMINILINCIKSNGVMASEQWHDYYEILYIMKGSAIQSINGRVEQLASGDMVIIAPNDTHSTVCNCPQGCIIIVMLFSTLAFDFDSSINKYSKYLTLFMENSTLKSGYIKAPYQYQSEIRSLSTKIYKEFTLKSHSYKLIIKGLMYQLLGTINRIRQQYKQEAEIPKSYNSIVNICKYIEEHYTEAIRLKATATMLGYSPEHLSRTFKKATGNSFKEFVDFVKMTEAKRLLISTDMSVTEVSNFLSFDCVSSFSRTFKRVFQISPSAFHKSCILGIWNQQ